MGLAPLRPDRQPHLQTRARDARDVVAQPGARPSEGLLAGPAAWGSRKQGSLLEGHLGRMQGGQVQAAAWRSDVAIKAAAGSSPAALQGRTEAQPTPLDITDPRF